jgi:AcrR family transcriptional regulator
LTAAQEQQVRDRIIRAAVGVFAEKGYHRATIADVVARSGLSVGAIYTHFSGKDELFLQSCDLISGQGLDELAARLAPLTTTAERLRAAIAYYVESIDDFDGQPGQASLVRAWAEAGEEPGVREMLVRRRERLLGAAQLLLREGIAHGELPDWLDVDGFARGFMALLDGLLLQRIEAGDAYRPEESVRRANAILDVLLAVRGAERPAVATA